MYAPDLFSNPTVRVLIPVVMRLDCFPYGYRGVILVMTSLAACCLATTAVSICNFAIVTTIWNNNTIQSCSVGYAQSTRNMFSSNLNSNATCPCAYNELAYDGATDAAWIFGLTMGLMAAGIGLTCWIAVLIACCCRRLRIRPWVFGSIYSFLGVTSFLTLMGFASKAVCGARHQSPETSLNSGAMSLRLCTFGPGAGMAIGAGVFYLLSSLISFFLCNEPTTSGSVGDKHMLDASQKSNVYQHNNPETVVKLNV